MLQTRKANLTPASSNGKNSGDENKAGDPLKFQISRLNFLDGFVIKHAPWLWEAFVATKRPLPQSGCRFVATKASQSHGACLTTKPLRKSKCLEFERIASFVSIARVFFHCWGSKRTHLSQRREGRKKEGEGRGGERIASNSYRAGNHRVLRISATRGRLVLGPFRILFLYFL